MRRPICDRPPIEEDTLKVKDICLLLSSTRHRRAPPQRSRLSWEALWRRRLRTQQVIIVNVNREQHKVRHNIFFTFDLVPTRRFLWCCCDFNNGIYLFLFSHTDKFPPPPKKNPLVIRAHSLIIFGVLLHIILINSKCLF